jgi:hypothetical protein
VFSDILQRVVRLYQPDTLLIVEIPGWAECITYYHAEFCSRQFLHANNSLNAQVMFITIKSDLQYWCFYPDNHILLF